MASTMLLLLLAAVPAGAAPEDAALLQVSGGRGGSLIEEGGEADAATVAPEIIDADGQSWDASEAVCASKGKTLCSYDQICPRGRGQPPVFAPAYTYGEHRWSPIADRTNDWVHIAKNSMHDLCKLHSPEYGLPAWGTQAKNKYNKHIYCCPTAPPITCPSNSRMAFTGPKFSSTHQANCCESANAAHMWYTYHIQDGNVANACSQHGITYKGKAGNSKTDGYMCCGEKLPEPVSWHLAASSCSGGRGESCDKVCSKEGKTCDLTVLKTVTTQAKMSEAASAAGKPCGGYWKGTYGGPWDGPHIDGGGTCGLMTNKDWQPSCGKTPACGWRRVCPCK